MDNITVPHRIETEVKTFEGDWTAEQIEAGLAGEPRIETHVAWYEPTPDGPREITDADRIRELEASIQ